MVHDCKLRTYGVLDLLFLARVCIFCMSFGLSIFLSFLVPIDALSTAYFHHHEAILSEQPAICWIIVAEK